MPTKKESREEWELNEALLVNIVISWIETGHSSWRKSVQCILPVLTYCLDTLHLTKYCEGKLITQSGADRKMLGTEHKK